MIHDLSFERFPEQFPRPFLRWIRWAARMSVRHADLLLALSESTRQDLIRLWGVAPERVEVGYPGIAPAPGPDLPRDPAVLYVGDFSPRKRVPLLIDAYRRYREVAGGPQPCDLLLVGGGGADAERVAAAATRTPGVRLLGRVDDRALDDLYRRSTLLVYPSLYEGFGLPIVEALSRGTPVLAARNSSLPEAGGGVSHYVDIDGAAGLGDRLAALLADRDALLSGADARRAHAARFSPQAAADRVADLLVRTIAGGR
jgi:glycosyltransferase involved in cell wall biosynthesis